MYPISAACGEGKSPSSPSLFSSNFQRRKAYILQQNIYQELSLWECTKRVSSQSTHCGFQSWASPEGFEDKFNKKEPVQPSECIEAAWKSLWDDPLGTVHKISPGQNIMSYVKTGALDYSHGSRTWACRGGERVNSAGKPESDVLERAHVIFTLRRLKGRYNLQDKSNQVDGSTILPEDRWSTLGAASVEAAVFVLDQPGPPPPPACNLRLIRGPLDFLIIPPSQAGNRYVTAVNVPSRLKVSYLKVALPIPLQCIAFLGHRLQQRSRLDFLEWASNNKLDSLMCQVSRGRCLQALAEDFNHRSRRQDGWRILHRGDVMITVRCQEVVVRPLLRSPQCSEQLLVTDTSGHVWRLHSVCLTVCLSGD